MRVALSFPGCYRRGGIERVVLEAANFLQSRGHETHLFADQWDDSVLHAAVVRHRVALGTQSPTKTVSEFRRLSHQALAQMQPSPDAIGSFGVMAPRDGVVWMQSVHAAWLEISRRERNWKGRLKQKLNPFHGLILRLEREQLEGRNYRHIVALTQTVKDDIMRFYGVPDSDISIVNNGYAPDEFNLARRDQERETGRRKLGFSPDDKVVVFVANELERKGFFPLLEAIAALGDERVHLLAVGRLDANACTSHLARLGLTRRVHFTGASDDVAAFYALADAFALPTQYEAWGLVIVEAMACGLPVLTSRLAGASVAVRENENGWLLEHPRDVAEISGKLRTLLQSSLKTEAVAASVIEYSWPQILPRYEEILQCYGVSS